MTNSLKLLVHNALSNRETFLQNFLGKLVDDLKKCFFCTMGIVICMGICYISEYPNKLLDYCYWYEFCMGNNHTSVIFNHNLSLFLIVIPANPSSFLAIHLLSVTFPTMMFVSFGYITLETIVPVTGRIGSNAIPDILIAIICVFIVNTVFSYMVSF